MQRFTYLLFQLEEARRYIADGRMEQLRVALLLLDNAAEMQMVRAIEHELIREEMKERLKRDLHFVPAHQRTGLLKELETFEPLSDLRKEKIDRNFDEKIRYLSGRRNLFPQSIASPLRYLHRYRNDAYHKMQIRPETIRTSAIIYLEINCVLLSALKPYGRGHSSGDDYSWLEETFGSDALSLMVDDTFPERAVEQLRADLLPNLGAVQESLEDHLLDRVDGLCDSLNEIMEWLKLENRDKALLEAQLYYKQKTAATHEPQIERDGFIPKYTLADVESISHNLRSIRETSDRLEAFARFSDLEDALEPIEHIIDVLAIDVDHAIQMEIDRRRGK